MHTTLNINHNKLQNPEATKPRMNDPEFEVKRTGTRQRPIYFDGEQLAFATTRTRDNRVRWSDAIFYRNDTNGGYVVAVGHKTDVSGERDNLFGEEVRTIGQGIMVIRRHVPELKDNIVAQLNQRETALFNRRYGQT